MHRACFFTFSSCRLSILLASEQMIAAFLVVTPSSVDHQAEAPSVPRGTILASDTLPGLSLIRVTARARRRGTRAAARRAGGRRPNRRQSRLGTLAEHRPALLAD